MNTYKEMNTYDANSLISIAVFYGLDITIEQQEFLNHEVDNLNNNEQEKYLDIYSKLDLS